jgi:hypothetical protein
VPASTAVATMVPYTARELCDRKGMDTGGGLDAHDRRDAAMLDGVLQHRVVG